MADWGASRRIVLLGGDEGSRSELASKIDELNLEVQPLHAATGLKARELLLARECRMVVADVPRSIAADNVEALLRSVFSGYGASKAKSTPVVVVVKSPSREDVVGLARLAKELQFEKFQLVVRASAGEGLEKAITTFLGKPVAAAASGQPAAGSSGGIFSSVVDELRTGSLPLPAMPTAVSKIRSLVAAGETSAEAIAEAVELDTAVTAMVLRLAGSVAYGRARRPRTLREAVTRIGAIQVSRIADMVLARACYSSPVAELAAPAAEAWQFTLARAHSVRHAGRFDGADIQDRHYLMAMLADVGCGFLVKAACERRGGAIELNEETLDFLLANHEVVGAEILKAWSAPQECVDLARNHHGESQPDTVARRFQQAGRLVAGFGYPSPFERIVPASFEEVGRDLIIVDKGDADRLQHEIERHLASAGAQITQSRAA